jgi:hypothetical protein
VGQVFTDATDNAQPVERVFQALGRVKRELLPADGTGERFESGRTRTADARDRKIDLRQHLRPRKEVRESGGRGLDALSESPNQAADRRGWISRHQSLA